MSMPKISIIIATKNAKSLLIETLENLQRQTYANLEVVVVDGASTDGTQTLLEKTPFPIVSKWISEPDRGISDAFNKGIALATGDYINFQGAGDLLCEPDTLEKLFSQVYPVVARHEVPKQSSSYHAPSWIASLKRSQRQTPMHTQTTLICARVLRVKEDGISPIWVSSPHRKKFCRQSLLFKMALPHQALFTHRRFFEKYGLFDLNVRFAMDYEILLRAYHDFPKVVLSNQLVSRWRAGGVGTNRIHAIFDEYDAIKRQHQIAPGWMLTLIDWFTRSKYKIKFQLGWAY